jgi:hypothetical protein
MVDAVLAQTGRAQSRLRALPARVVVYLLLAGCLFAEVGYPGVWQRLTAGVDGLTRGPRALVLACRHRSWLKARIAGGAGATVDGDWAVIRTRTPSGPSGRRR